MPNRFYAMDTGHYVAMKARIMPAVSDVQACEIVREAQGNDEQALNVKAEIFGPLLFPFVVARQSNRGDVQAMAALTGSGR